MQSGDKDNGGGEDGWLSSIEEQYLQTIGAEPDYERLYQHERDTSQRSVWSSFQESATSIAQLYRGDFFYFWLFNFRHIHSTGLLVSLCVCVCVRPTSRTRRADDETTTTTTTVKLYFVLFFVRHFVLKNAHTFIHRMWCGCGGGGAFIEYLSKSAAAATAQPTHDVRL